MEDGGGKKVRKYVGGRKVGREGWEGRREGWEEGKREGGRRERGGVIDVHCKN